MNIDRVPGAVWPIVYTAIYLGLQSFVSAQWPDTPPSYILGAMVTLGALQGLLKVMWPAPSAPELPPGVSAQAGLAGPVPEKKPGRINRFFI